MKKSIYTISLLFYFINEKINKDIIGGKKNQDNLDNNIIYGLKNGFIIGKNVQFIIDLNNEIKKTINKIEKIENTQNNKTKNLKRIEEIQEMQEIQFKNIIEFLNQIKELIN